LKDGLQIVGYLQQLFVVFRKIFIYKTRNEGSKYYYKFFCNEINKSSTAELTAFNTARVVPKKKHLIMYSQ
jgi:hypothetical protein